MSNAAADPFVDFKGLQREGWSLFAPLETLTTIPAARLVEFAGLRSGQTVLDVACGTGVVAITAARAGAAVAGLDLTPALLERARQNAAIAQVPVDFKEGDAEALPYPDASFDVVLSQFGHMFAPRPQVVTAELLRVLKPGGRLAFASWPPEHFVGKMFACVGRYLPPPPAGAPVPAPPPQWGDPNIVRERLGDAVEELTFDRGTMIVPALSPNHSRLGFETSLGPLVKLVAALQAQPERLARLRAELTALIEEVYADNHLRQQYLLTRAVKRD